MEQPGQGKGREGGVPRWRAEARAPGEQRGVCSGQKKRGVRLFANREMVEILV